jgi:uncharacterized RDD family membrane protein YckC
MGSDSSSQTTLLRVAAFLVDALSMSILLILPSSVVSYSMAWFGGTVKAISLVWFISLGVLVLGMLLRDGWRGRSIGKQLLGLRLITPHGDGCGWLRSVVRNALLVLFPVEMILVLRGRPRLGDRVARTVVTEE